MKSIENIIQPVWRKHMVPLSEADPAVAAEWCYERNCGWGPEDFSHGSNTKAWWKCARDPAHIWAATISNRTSKIPSGCPYCQHKLPTPENNLGVLYPHLVEQWHPTKNNAGLTIFDLLPSSSLDIWWRCQSGHEWSAAPARRTCMNTGCPYCSNTKVCTSNCLANVRPDIAREWHPTKNGKLTPAHVTPGSRKVVYWQCPVDQRHVYETAVSKRSNGTINCPYCSGRRVSDSNSLAALRPSIAAEWHKSRNGSLNPSDVTAQSSQKVWWQCPKNPRHVWECLISQRTAQGRSCPDCRREAHPPLTVDNPKVAAEWHPSKNKNLNLDDKVTATSTYKVWWRCSQNSRHEWQEYVWRRAFRGCPHCRLERRCLSKMYPAVATQLHPKLNGDLTADKLMAYSKQRVFWLCPENKKHVWQATVSNRTGQSSGCPHCAGRIAAVPGTVAPSENSLAFLRSDLAAQWHPRLNEKLTPCDVTCGSNRRVWWLCASRRHEWQQSVAKRTNQETERGCRQCRLIERKGSLADLYPEVAAEWHPTKNRYLFPRWNPKLLRLEPLRVQKNRRIKPRDVAAHSKEEVWWQCPFSVKHVWKARICDRTAKGQKCPMCSGKTVVQDNCLAVTHKRLAKQWHPTRNLPLTPELVTVRSKQIIYWRCFRSAAHIWSEPIQSMVRKQKLGHSGCPFCSGRRIGVENSLRAKAPQVAARWHPSRNLPLTPDQIAPASARIVWWQCPKRDSHVWAAAVSNMVRAQRFSSKGCPFCSGHRVKKEDSLSALYPEVAALWDRARNLSLFPKQVTAMSNKKVFWRCKESADHVWEAQIWYVVTRWKKHGVLCSFCNTAGGGR